MKARGFISVYTQMFLLAIAGAAFIGLMAGILQIVILGVAVF